MWRLWNPGHLGTYPVSSSLARSRLCRQLQEPQRTLARVCCLTRKRLSDNPGGFSDWSGLPQIMTTWIQGWIRIHLPKSRCCCTVSKSYRGKRLLWRRKSSTLILSCTVTRPVCFTKTSPTIWSSRHCVTTWSLGLQEGCVIGEGVKLRSFNILETPWIRNLDHKENWHLKRNSSLLWYDWS